MAYFLTVLALLSVFFAVNVFCQCLFFVLNKEIRNAEPESNSYLLPIIVIFLLMIFAFGNGMVARFLAISSLDKLLFSLACVAYANATLICFIAFLNGFKCKLFKLDQDSEKKTVSKS